MRILLKPLHGLYLLYAFTLFLILMIPVFIWSLLVLPLGKVRGGNLIYYGCMLWADIWYPLVFIWHRNIFQEPLRKDTSYIFVANHISYFDSAMIPKMFRHPIRPLGKVEMSKIPIFGFIYKNVIVSVDRSTAALRAKSFHQLISVLHKGISVLVFPEGTFNTTHKPLKEFYDGAFRMAIETQTPIRPVVLLTSYDRMHSNSFFSLNPGKSRALFLKEVSVETLTLRDVSALKAKVYAQMEAALIDQDVTWIKKSE